MVNYSKVNLNLIITHFLIYQSGFIYFYWFIGIILLIGLDIGGEDDRAEILNNAWDDYPIYLRCLINRWCKLIYLLLCVYCFLISLLVEYMFKSFRKPSPILLFRSTRTFGARCAPCHINRRKEVNIRQWKHWTTDECHSESLTIWMDLYFNKDRSLYMKRHYATDTINHLLIQGR